MDLLILASADAEGVIAVWDANSNSLVKTLAGQIAPLGSLAVSSDNKLIAAGSADKTVKIWDLENGQLLHSLAGHEKAISAVAFSPNNRFAASGGWDSKLKIWDARAGTEIKNLTGHISVIDSLCFSPDGKILASSSSDETIKFWNVDTGKLINTIKVESKLPYFSIQFSPDGKHLAGGHFYEYTVWDAATGKIVFSNRQEIANIAGRYSIKDRTVKYTPPGTLGVGALFSVLNGNSVAYSPDGKTLMVRQSTGLNLLDAATGEKKLNLEGDFWQVKSFSFSADGKFLIGGGERDGSVKIWDAESGKIISEFKERSAGGVSALFVGKNGKTLINTSQDGLIRIWDLPAGRLFVVLTTIGEDDWVVASSNGFFDASPNAEKKLAYDFRSEVIGAEQLKSRFYVKRGY
ncbi:MAG: WD40 repeat domain-containing protein [Pyrinomonadaceae bacterium]|nr:WD40 repeat domain-containing protein [Pyrinomonadaceae bacterium]